jgi:hypothetical protein
MKGKDPRENQFKIAQYEEPIDPSNPMAGTRKVPLMIDAQGRVQAITPPGAASPQWTVARAVHGRREEADPRNKGASDDDLRKPLAEELRRRQVMAVYDPFKDPAPAKGASIADPFAQGYEAPTIGGEFKKGIASGIDNLQASLYGLAGLAGDFTGVKPVKNWGLDGYARNNAEAEANAPAVGRIEDVGGVKDAALYAAGGLGSLVPFVASSAATGGVGGIVGQVRSCARGVEKTAGALIASGRRSRARRQGPRRMRWPRPPSAAPSLAPARSPSAWNRAPSTATSRKRPARKTPAPPRCTASARACSTCCRRRASCTGS